MQNNIPAAFLALALLALAGCTQPYGTLEFIVFSTNSNPVQNAGILIESSTGEPSYITTNGTGKASVNLPEGTYSATITKDGFETGQLENLMVITNQATKTLVTLIPQNTQTPQDTQAPQAGTDSQPDSEAAITDWQAGEQTTTDIQPEISGLPAAVQITGKPNAPFDTLAEDVYYTGTFCPSGGGECSATRTPVPLTPEDFLPGTVLPGIYSITFHAQGYKDVHTEFVVNGAEVSVREVG